MNPILRWVKKIIQIFLPSPAPAPAPVAPVTERVTPLQEKPKEVEVTEVISPMREVTERAEKVVQPVAKGPEPEPVVAKIAAPEYVKSSPLTGPLPQRESTPPKETEEKMVEAVVEVVKSKSEPEPVIVAEIAPKKEEPLPVKKEEPKIESVVEVVALKRELKPVTEKVEAIVEVVKAEPEPEPAITTIIAPEKETPLPEKKEEPKIESVVEVVEPKPEPKPVIKEVVEVKAEQPIEPVVIESKPEPKPVTPEPITPEEKLPEKTVLPKIYEAPSVTKSEALPERKLEKKPVFTGRVELTPALDNPARLRQIKGVISVHDIANRELLDLVPYEPGKPVDDVAREIGLDPSSIIKLASNENPLGPSPLAMAAMHEAINTCHFYPDGGGFHLRNAIAHTFGLGRENVVLGNGSNEIIELLFHTFTRPGIHEIVTARHAFAVYTLMAQLFGVHAIVVDDKDFTPDLDAMLRAVTPQTRLIFLASPNNPTGTRVTNEALDAFIRDLPPHVIAVLDEAYYEFLDNPPDTVGYVKNGAQVVLMRTFSKIQGLAGLRVGYGLAAAEIANLLQRARQPFNANLIAQAGAMAGLADVEHQKKTKAITDEGRKLIEETFAKMGLKYVPSAANFVMVHVGDGGEVFKRLMKKGIIVRSMVSYHLPEYIRVSIGTPEQNARFLAELPAAMEGLVAIKQS